MLTRPSVELRCFATTSGGHQQLTGYSGHIWLLPKLARLWVSKLDACCPETVPCLPLDQKSKSFRDLVLAAVSESNGNYLLHF